MATSTAEIKQMYERGERMGASHMIIATDWFDHTDYPIYVMPGEDPRRKAPQTGGDRVMECYRYALGWELQAEEARAFHWEF